MQVTPTSPSGAVHAAPNGVTLSANAKRIRSASSVAIDRFLHDSWRRSCSFVNLSSEALDELTTMAQQNHMVLTSRQEPNVGSVTRLLRNQRPVIRRSLRATMERVSASLFPPSPSRFLYRPRA